jgi:hypothetical protein
MRLSIKVMLTSLRKIIHDKLNASNKNTVGIQSYVESFESHHERVERYSVCIHCVFSIAYLERSTPSMH